MKLGQVALQVNDLARSVSFYRDVVGLPLLFEFPNLAFFDMGGVRLMLSAAQNEAEHHESVLYYLVEEIQDAFKSLVARGARADKTPHLIAKMPDHDLWMAFVRDPNDRLVGLMSEVRAGVTPA